MSYLVLIALASLIQGFAISYDDLNKSQTVLGKNVEQTSVYLYLVIELTCCLLFITTYLRTGKIKKILLPLNALFAVYAITYCSLHVNQRSYPWYITITESALIISGALYFFYELFHYKPHLHLVIEPSFWAISGMLVMYSAVIPLFLVFDSMRKSSPALTDKLYAINNVFYSLLFITFIIAILLDKKPVPGVINALEDPFLNNL